MSEAAVASLISSGQKDLTPASFLDGNQLARMAVEQRFSLHLAQLDEEHVTAFCRFLGMSDFGGKALSLPRLQKHLEYLMVDDQLIAQEGVESLNTVDLAKALEERGMKSISLEVEKQRELLQNWLSLRQIQDPAPIPDSLLLFSRVFLNAPTTPPS